MAEWCEVRAIRYRTVQYRLREGWSEEEAIFPERRVKLTDNPKRRVKPTTSPRARTGSVVKLTPDRVRWLRANPELTAAEAARILNISANQVWNVRHGRYWAWLD